MRVAVTSLLALLALPCAAVSGIGGSYRCCQLLLPIYFVHASPIAQGPANTRGPVANHSYNSLVNSQHPTSTPSSILGVTANRLLYNWSEGKQDDASSSHLSRIKKENTVLFIWIITAIVSASLFFIFAVKWYLERRFRIKFCRSTNNRLRRLILGREAFIEYTQRLRDAAIAAEREAKLNKDERKVEADRKRELLRNFITTVEIAHLKGTGNQDIVEALEEGDSKQDDSNADNSAVLYLPGRPCTSAECRICLTDITAGDSITRSPNPECIHIYHTACILDWLSESKAKSDCPCCRLPFIPEGYDNAKADEKEEETATRRNSDETILTTSSASDGDIEDEDSYV